MTKGQCSEDLLALRRTGRLSTDQAKALDAHIQSCPACGLEAALHDELEQVGQPRMGDEVLIAKVVQGALAARSRRPRRLARPWMLAAAAALVVLVAGGLASGGMWLYHRITLPDRSEAAPPRDSKEEPAARARHRTEVPAARVQPAPIEEVSPQRAPAAMPPPPAERPRALSPRPVAVSPQPPASSQSEVTALFAAANEARRVGNTPRAVRLYTDLQRMYPGTREARLSYISFGRMLLDQGRPSEALSQFDSYLRQTPNDVLAAEALYGRARSLTALHRGPDARRIWAELLSRFPDSVYADLARRQLGGQGRGPAPTRE